MSETQQGGSGRLLVLTRLFQPSFSSGELAPALHYRSDLAKWRTGVAVAQNWIVTPQGGMARRPGTQYVGTGKDPYGTQRLIPFQFSTDQQYVIEVGPMYMRFIFGGAYLANSDGTPYEIATPYAAPALSTLRYVQSADVLTIVHSLYQPMELKRLGVLNWTLTSISTGSALPAPLSVIAVGSRSQDVPGSPSPSTLNFVYAVTARSYATHDEGALSAPAVCTNKDLGYYNQYGYKNTVSWAAVSGADFYIVYRKYAGVWAKIGSTTDLSFDDTNFVPNTANGPPVATNPFTGGNWPGTVGYFQERRIFAGSIANPETVWGSKSGNYTNFDVSDPVQDDDAITYRLAARQVNQIRHLVLLDDLIVFTGGGGWKVDGSAAITPANFTARPQSFVGSSDVDPLVIGNRILFVEAKGSSVREIAYQFVANQYVSQDRSIYAKHMFEGHSIVSWAYAESPSKVVWAIRDDGALLSLTYLAEEEVYAWCLHQSVAGIYKSVAVISEVVDGVREDVPYFVVQRVLISGTVSIIERMRSRRLGANNDDVTQAWHVDCGLRYSGAPVKHVSGLDHLNGSTVAVLADGVSSYTTVSGGAVTLPTAASTVTVGIAMFSTLDLLPADSLQPANDPWIGRFKRCYRARIALENAVGLQVSVDGEALTTFVDPDSVPGSSQPMVTGVLESRPAEGWHRGGQLTVSAVTALPATVLGLALEWEVGE